MLTEYVQSAIWVFTLTFIYQLIVWSWKQPEINVASQAPGYTPKQVVTFMRRYNTANTRKNTTIITITCVKYICTDTYRIMQTRSQFQFSILNQRAARFELKKLLLFHSPPHQNNSACKEICPIAIATATLTSFVLCSYFSEGWPLVLLSPELV